jgi:diguanylate cyclase (GGDEF)-like protein/putative nucleotidyltransferase with HDIG domain
VIGINKISKDEPTPEKSAFFEAVRRHACQILGFDFGFIDIVNGHEMVTVGTFSADENDEEIRQNAFALHDDHNQSLTLANTHYAQKTRQSRQVSIGRAFDKKQKEKNENKEGYPYVILPILSGQPGTNAQVKGLIRLISFDSLQEINEDDMAALQLMTEHLSSRMPAFDLTGDKDLESKPGDAEATTLYGGQIEGYSTILIAHANRPMRRRFSRILGSKYRVLEAENETRALEALNNKNIDLMILDCEINEKATEDFCSTVKESPKWKDIPVVLVSPETNATARIEGLNAGADDCLSEACLDPELLTRVKSLLKHRAAEREISVQSQLLEAYAQRFEQATEKLTKELSKEKQIQLQRNQQLERLRWQSEVLRTQDTLLHRISNTIRRSFDIRENLTEMLEDLSGWFNLDTCFVVLPGKDSPDDLIRCEYVSDATYGAKEFDIDLKTYEIFQKHYRADQCLIINDVANEALLDPFRQETLTRQHVISLFYIPISYEEKLLGLLVGFKCESEAEWNSDNEVFLKSVADQVATGVVNARLYARVQRQATTDGLTGLLNHRTGQEKLTEQLRLSERYQRNIAVIMIDVDHFKAINDTYGHPAGDTVLKAVAKLIQRDCRDVDLPVRYGGEEFLLVLPEINLEGAATVAERIRKNLEQEVIDHENISISVTASMGVATFPEDARSQQQLLDLADKALYASKRNGRNQVHTASDLLYNEIAPHGQEQDKRVSSSASGSELRPAKIKSPIEYPLDRPLQPKASQSSLSEHPDHNPLPASDKLPDTSNNIDSKSVFAEAPAQPEGTSLPNSPGLSTTAGATKINAKPNVVDSSAESPVPYDTKLAAEPISNSTTETQADSFEEKDELVPEVVEMVKALATTLYSQSEYNKIHHLETARLSELLAKMMGLPQQRVEQVRVASLLHDVGTLSISADLLNKQEPFTNEERQVINQHTVLGAELLRPIKALREICDILEYHHERWDGAGYPRGLKGESIPLPARIISLVDSYHAMISDRPYRKALTEAQAMDALRAGAGSQFDPFLVDIFITILTNPIDNQPSSPNQQSTSTSSP